jgi:ACS family D-galactonate transporter-like MFS transporter
MRTSISQESAVPLAGQQKRTKARIVILLLLSIGTMINYLDRTILGIVAPALSNEIHIDPAMMGIVFPPLPGPTRWRKFPEECF